MGAWAGARALSQVLRIRTVWLTGVPYTAARLGSGAAGLALGLCRCRGYRDSLVSGLVLGL